MLVEGHPRNIPLKLFQNPWHPLVKGKSFKSFSIFSSGGHLFTRAKRLEQFRLRVMEHLFVIKIHSFVKEKKLFKCFFYF